MSLLGTPVERDLARRLRQARRGSRELRRQDRSVRRRHTPGALLSAFNWWPVVTILWAAQARRLPSLMFVQMVLCLGMLAAARAGFLGDALRAGPDVGVLSTLPVADGAIFARVFRRSWLPVLGVPPVFVVVALLAFGVPADAVTWALLLMVALATAGVVAALAVAAVSVAPRHPWGRWAVGLAVLACALGLGARLVPEPAAARAWTVLAVTPLGWPIAATRWALAGNTLLATSALGAMAMLAATTPVWRRRAESRYRIAELVYLQQIPVVAYEDEARVLSRVAPLPLAEETPSPGELDLPRPPLDDDAGWTERIVRALLPAAALPVAGWLLGTPPGWSRDWRTGMFIAAAAAATGAAGAPALGWFGLIFSTALALPVLGGRWPGLAAVPVATLQSCPRHALVPVGYFPASRVVLTANLVRSCMAVPGILAAAHILQRAGRGWGHLEPTGGALAMVASVLLAGVLVQPAAVALRFSTGSSDSLSREWRTWAVAAVLVPALLLIGIAITAILLDVHVFVWAPALTGLSLGTWATYGWMYGRWIDLVGRPAQDLS